MACHIAILIGALAGGPALARKGRKVTKRDKRTLVKGAAIGLAAGAFLPDSINPISLVRQLVAKIQGAV